MRRVPRGIDAWQTMTVGARHRIDEEFAFYCPECVEREFDR